MLCFPPLTARVFTSKAGKRSKYKWCTSCTFCTNVDDVHAAYFQKSEVWPLLVPVGDHAFSGTLLCGRPIRFAAGADRSVFLFASLRSLSRWQKLNQR